MCLRGGKELVGRRARIARSSGSSGGGNATAQVVGMRVKVRTGHVYTGASVSSACKNQNELAMPQCNARNMVAVV